MLRAGSAAAVLVALVVAASATTARADTGLAKAQAALDASDYAGAGAALDSALATGANSPSELAEIYKLRGIVAAALGDAAAASTAFQHLLALQPDATLPSGTSPKIMKPFAAASEAARAAGPLAVHVETTPGTPTTPASLALVVAHDPLGMVQKARATVTLDGKAAPAPLEAAGTERIVIQLPRATRIEVHVAALDEHGNQVVLLGDTPPIAIVSELPAVVVVPPPPPPAEHARPVYLAWWAYGGVAIAAAAVGTGYGLEARSASQQFNALVADSIHHTFAEAQAEKATAQHDATVTNVSFIVAGVFALASGALYATRPPAHASREHAQLVPLAARTGAGLAVELPW